jgi:hypothetical protein
MWALLELQMGWGGEEEKKNVGAPHNMWQVKQTTILD